MLLPRGFRIFGLHSQHKVLVGNLRRHLDGPAVGIFSGLARGGRRSPEDHSPVFINHQASSRNRTSIAWLRPTWLQPACLRNDRRRRVRWRGLIGSADRSTQCRAFWWFGLCGLRGCVCYDSRFGLGRHSLSLHVSHHPTHEQRQRNHGQGQNAHPMITGMNLGIGRCLRLG